ncbi:hypothetical protein, partial [Bradyrhizobium sp.]|uniref:hypothetical protein n=1 Tax=Bradyrhizobium sp. TaxID=376 RepID=UPI002E082026|nr:hypothetical protein [Bradyrhizobium sp.]
AISSASGVSNRLACLLAAVMIRRLRPQRVAWNLLAVTRWRSHDVASTRTMQCRGGCNKC